MSSGLGLGSKSQANMTDDNRAALVKGRYKALGVNWAQKLLARHPEIKTVHIPPLDKERAIGQDPAIFKHCFELY